MSASPRSTRASARDASASTRDAAAARTTPASSPLPPARSALCTVLVARIERIGAEAESGASAPMEILRRILRRFGGRIVRSSPGEVWAEMRSPTDALHCGGALHDALRLEAPGFPFEVELRVAVASGECERRGGEIGGPPVRTARALLEGCGAGEVRFDRAVLLSANRSEVRGEPAANGWSYLLLPPSERAFPSLPFHGLWLHRRTSWRVRLGEGARAAGKGALAATRTRAFRIACGLAILAAGVVQLLPPTPREQVESALSAGRTEEAALHAARWVGSHPEDPQAHLWEARAELGRGRPLAARSSFENALALDPSLARQPEVAFDLVRLLEQKGADTSFVARYETPAVEEALVDASRSDDYWLRHNAARALEKMGRGEEVDRIGLLLLDLQHESSCGIRMRAARSLASLGTRDPRVLPALERARTEDLPHAICNLRQVIDESIASLAG